MKSILLHVHDDHAQDARLQVALDLARACQSHLSCVQATPFNRYVVGDAFGGFYAATTLPEEEQEQERIEQRLKGEDIPWDWYRGDQEPAHVLVSRGRLADVLILSRQDKGRGDKPAPLPIVADVAVHARAPVLVVPPETNGFRVDRPVAIAWNGSIEAAHSLRLSLSLLHLAAQVHIITVSDEELDFPSTDASRYLARHDIPSELHEWPRKGRSIAQSLSDAAIELDASCLIMGAYGHSRLRETVLGGVTRELLAETAVPLLLAH